MMISIAKIVREPESMLVQILLESSVVVCIADDTCLYQKKRLGETSIVVRQRLRG